LVVTVSLPAAAPCPVPLVFTVPVLSMALSNIISVRPTGRLKWRGQTYRCAVGRGGIGAAKREGDHASPLGCFALRKILFRADRISAPQSDLPVSALSPSDGWCDAPNDAAYNQAVSLPYPASAETLWRDDSIYDLIVVLGHNDSPVVPGCGSAIFLHVAQPNFTPTEGCVALARGDLLEVLNDCDHDSQICIMA
jgi:L,D-peptidoglycan transpeptidase YkuD (ErfK/YbiS/YcfS/YnhG family)